MSADFIEKYWLIGFFCVAIVLYVFGISGYLVQEDARKRGLNKPAVTFWSVGVVFLGVIFLPLYLLFRSRAVFAGAAEHCELKPVLIKLCPYCGTENPPRDMICLNCHRRMDIDTPSIGEKSCPYCGTMNIVEADRCKQCDQVIGYMEQ